VGGFHRVCFHGLGVSRTEWSTVEERRREERGGGLRAGSFRRQGKDGKLASSKKH